MRCFLMSVLIATVAAGPALAQPDERGRAYASRERQASPTPASAEGQQPTPEPSPAPAKERAQTQPPQLTNVRLEVTITDERGSGQPTTKTVALVLADRAHGRIRTTGDVQIPLRTKGTDGAVHTRYNTQRVVLNVDAYPEFTRDGRVRTQVTLEYRPVAGEARDEDGTSDPAIMAAGLTTISETFVVVLENGKPLVVSQSADPTTDRRVRVEVKATILK